MRPGEITREHVEEIMAIAERHGSELVDGRICAGCGRGVSVEAWTACRVAGDGCQASAP